MKLLQRIGTQKFKYEFEINIQKLEINTETTASITWQRANCKVTTGILTDLESINKDLKMTATLYYEPKSKVFLSKQTKINIENSKNKIGFINIDLAYYANLAALTNCKEKKEVLSLKDCSDLQAKLYINIKFSSEGQVEYDDDVDNDYNQSIQSVQNANNEQDQLNEQIKNQEFQLQQKQNEISSLKKKVIEYQNHDVKLDEYQEKNFKLEQNLSQKNQEISQLKIQLNLINEEYQGMRNQQRDSLTRSSIKRDEEQNKNLDKIFELEKYITQKNLEFSKLREENKEISQKLQKIQQKQDQQIKEFQSQLQQEKQKRQKVIDQCKELEKRLDIGAKAFDDQIIKGKQLHQKYQQVMTAYNTLKEDFQNQKDILQKYETNQNQAIIYDQEIKQHKETIEQLRQHTSDQQQELIKLQDQNQHFQKSYQDQQAQFQKQIIEKNEYIQQIQSRIEKANQYFKETSQQWEKKLQDVCLENKRYKEDKDDLNQQLTQISIGNQNLKVEIQKKDLKIRTLEEEIEFQQESQNSSIIKDQEIQQLKLKIKSDEYKLMELQENNQNIQEYENKIEQLREENDSLIKYHDHQYKQSIQDAKSKLHQLEQKHQKNIYEQNNIINSKEEQIRYLLDDKQQLENHNNELRLEIQKQQIRLVNSEANDNQKQNLHAINQKKYIQEIEYLQGQLRELRDKQLKNSMIQENNIQDAHLSVENENLKLKLEKNNNLIKQLHIQIDNYEKKLQNSFSSNDQISVLKEKLQSFENQQFTQIKTIEEQTQTIKQFDFKITKLNEEIVKKSMKLGDIFNLVMNQGSQDLFGKVTDIMGAN